jgi:gliding motility-associated transport system permease protein
MPFVHHETETTWRQTALYALGALGFVMAAAGFIGDNVSENFLLPYGLMLTVLGFCFLWAFAVLQGSETDFGYRAALAIGVVGALAFLVAVGRSAVPPLAHALHWGARPAPFFMPSGLLLMGTALIYMALSIGLTSDNSLVVMTRRELAGIFYSPIAYIVLCGMVVVGWALFDQFIRMLLRMSMQTGALEEPILFGYVISWWPIICMILVVPVITMRTFSEERRTGTLEVLLTAPVSETAVVVGKFLATFIFFMLAVLPWGLYLLALRIEGGQPFEYRPLLSFFVALACSGAGFLAMGLFFSSLTRNQIASALLTAVGMIGWTIVFFIGQSETLAGTMWATVLHHISYIHLWWASMEGMIVPPMLLFHVSAAIFWLFLTVKVLEARKWV